MPRTGPEKLLERLSQGKSIPVVVLVGADGYLRDLCRKALRNTFVPEEARNWTVAKFSAAETDWEEVFRRAQIRPMLAPCQLLILEDVETLERLEDSAAEAALEVLAAYFDDPAPFSVLLLEAASLDQRRKLYKLLAEKALLVELSMGSMSPATLAAQMAKELGAELDRDAAALLADAANSEPARIHTELEKLSLYAAGRPITAADVEALVVSAKRYTVWQLADMLAERRSRPALEFLDRLLREGEQPAGLVGAMAWMYRKLIEARGLPAHTDRWQAARHLGMRPEAAELASRQGRRISLEELLSGMVALAEADSQLKSGVREPRAVLECLVSRLTGGAAA